MNTDILATVHKDQLKERPEIQIGDTVKLSMRISEGENSRIQVFEGIVIAMKGSGLDATVTVRKISNGVGVERIIPLHAPTLENVEIVKRAKARRSKLYYMRQRVGRKAMKVAKSEFIVADKESDKKEQDKSVETVEEKSDNVEAVEEDLS